MEEVIIRPSRPPSHRAKSSACPGNSSDCESAHKTNALRPTNAGRRAFLCRPAMRGLLGHVLGAGVVEEAAGGNDRGNGIGGGQGEDGAI